MELPEATRRRLPWWKMLTSTDRKSDFGMEWLLRQVDDEAREAFSAFAIIVCFV